MGLSELEAKCFAALDDTSMYEELRIDRVEELVSEHYPDVPFNKRQKIALDIMWKHQDPSRAKKSNPRIVKVSEIEAKVDIPDLERRLQLERQFLELDAMNQASHHKSINNSHNPAQQRQETNNEYDELLQSTTELKNKLYGDNDRPLASKNVNVSPIDHISAFFDGTIPRTRINQALKSSGYNVLDAVQLIISQLKQGQDSTATTPTTQAAQLNSFTPPPPSSQSQQPFFVPGKENKAICSFLLKTGKCLRSDCQFSHDIEQRVCSFWLNGRCIAGEHCQFKHSLDDLSGNPEQNSASITEQPKSIPTEDMFPALGSTTTSTQTPKSSTKKFNPGSSSAFIPSSAASASSFVPSPTITTPTTYFEPVKPVSRAIPIVRPLRKPKQVPWETDDPNEHLKNYLTHRSNAIKFENQRKKFAQISTEAWKSNDGARSKQMSEKANKFEQKCFDALKLADDELYNYSEVVNDEVWFEFHGLEFNEAVEQLQSSIKEVKEKSKKQTKIVYLVVPSISWDHAQYKKTTKPISLWLDHEGYRWQIHSCGDGQYGSIIAIDPWSTWQKMKILQWKQV